MSKSHDPSEPPRPSEHEVELGTRLGLILINVMCVENDHDITESSVSFAAWVSFVPRTGDRIGLEDGKTCEVIRVYHKVVTIEQDGITLVSMHPNVYAKAVVRGD